VADARACDAAALHGELAAARARLAAAEAAAARPGPADETRPDILEAAGEEYLGGCAAEHQRARTPAVPSLHSMYYPLAMQQPGGCCCAVRGWWRR